MKAHRPLLPDSELTPRQFVEALVRTAVLLNERVRPAVRPHKSLRQLLEDKVVAFATQSNTDTFRQELQNRDVRKVFKRHRYQLQRVFSHYASLEVRTTVNRTQAARACALLLLSVLSAACVSSLVCTLTRVLAASPSPTP